MCRIGIAVWVLLVMALAGLPAGVQAQSDVGLVAEWHFDEGSGSVLVDSSGNGNDGVIYGATWVDGKYGKALSFDGVDDYVKVFDNKNLNFGPNQDFTLAAWIKPKPDQTSFQGTILAKMNPQGSSPKRAYGYSLMVRGVEDTTNKGTIGIWLGDGVGGNYGPFGLYSNTVHDDDNWHHVVATIDRDSSAELYIDGYEVNSADISHLSYIDESYPENLEIGREGVGDTYEFKGIIDEVRIYNRALTAEEIKSHYEGKLTALSITKSASPHSIKQGQTTTITLTVENIGTTEITDIEVSDTFPTDLTFVSGETSETYASLRPKDSREFQYTIQLNEAGTFNPDPATVTYADEDGNYHTVKSKTAAIRVIPSTDQLPTPQTAPKSSNEISTASVHLHGEKTDVVIGEDILLKLAAVNLITKPTMHVQVIITPPSGMSVTSSEFVQSGAGLFTASYEIEPGVGRDIEVKMRSNQVGDFVVNGRIVYYFGDDMDGAEDHTLTLPITVRAEAEAGAGAERTTDTSGSDGSSTPGFAAVVAVIGLLLAYVRKRA